MKKRHLATSRDIKVSSPIVPERQSVIQSISIRNFKSILDSTAIFSRFSIIIGKNASGKSNLLDAVDFVADALVYDMDSAFRDRGGIQSVLHSPTQLRRGGAPPSDESRTIRLELKLALRSGREAAYMIEIRCISRSSYRIARERCIVDGQTFQRRNREVEVFDQSSPPRAKRDRLYLSSLSSASGFGEVYDLLTNFTIYKPDVAEMRAYQPADSGDILVDDAWNFASVLRKLARLNRPRAARLALYLSAIAPGIVNVVPKSYGPMETVQFQTPGRLNVIGNALNAREMSDGSLRALAILLAMFQPGTKDDPVSVIAIEEPETGLHPAATAVLYDAIREASRFRQILITSHSPDLLDNASLSAGEIVVARYDQGETTFSEVSPNIARLLIKEMATPGELLRRDQLES